MKNLLYIHSDQHNPRVAGCYGDPLVKTPNLDALARRGVLFENTYCPSPICVPSRMSMLTGRHPFENRVWTNTHALSSAIPTLAHSMGAGGYRPVLIGRMHALGPDQLHGYVERLVGDHSGNYPGGRDVDHGVLTGTNGPNRVSLVRSGHGQNAYQVHDEAVTDAAVEYLESVGDDAFSLSVGFMLPHQPFVARLEDYRDYFDRIGSPDNPEPGSDEHPHHAWWRKACGIENVPHEESRRARAAYWALVQRMDILIGRILDALERSGSAGDTLVVYTSDHGEQVGEHGLWWKQTFYEDSVKVPAILSCPGLLPEGSKIDRVVSALDINATILDALRCPALPNSRGRSLLPLAANPALESWEDIAFSEFCLDADGSGGPFPETGVFQRMIRKGQWKFNYYHGQRCQLFNLEEDPGEVNDRWNDPTCEEVKRNLLEEVLREWNPVKISDQMQDLRKDQVVMRAWAGKCNPPDSFRWPLAPEMDYLDSEQIT